MLFTMAIGIGFCYAFRKKPDRHSSAHEECMARRPEIGDFRSKDGKAWTSRCANHWHHAAGEALSVVAIDSDDHFKLRNAEGEESEYLSLSHYEYVPDWEVVYKGFVEDDDEQPEELIKDFFRMESEQLIESLGLSGLSVLTKDKNGICELLLISGQAFTIQYSVLYAMWSWLLDYASQEQSKGANPNTVPTILLLMNIYLHFLNVWGEIPFAVSMLMHFHQVRPTLMAIPIFILDGIVTPTLTLLIGSLFLCSSEGTLDLMLNSCAVAFISSIDNWILKLNGKMKRCSGWSAGKSIYLPYNKALVWWLDHTVCIVPVVPLLWCMMAKWIATNSIRLIKYD